jgi:hypothetical protein
LVNVWNVGAELTNRYSSLDEELISTSVSGTYSISVFHLKVYFTIFNFFRIADVWNSYSLMPYCPMDSPNVNKDSKTKKKENDQSSTKVSLLI